MIGNLRDLREVISNYLILNNPLPPLSELIYFFLTYVASPFPKQTLQKRF